jgi:hypothetical protein
MKLTLLVSIFYLMLPALSLGQIANPQIRICLQTQGRFEVVQIPALRDLYGFCAYQSARMNSLALMSWVWERKSNLARDTFLANQSKRNCLQVGGRIVLGQIFTTVDTVQTLSFCFFNDGSALDTQSLALGPDSPSNALIFAALQP